MQEENASANEICRKLVEDFRQEVERLKDFPNRHEMVKLRLSFVVDALRQLCDDQNFVDLLHAEGLDTMPKHLANLIWPSASNTA